MIAHQGTRTTEKMKDIDVCVAKACMVADGSLRCGVTKARIGGN